MLRHSPRVVVAWVAAAAVAATTTSIVAGDLAALHRRARALGPERAAVFARRELPLGTRIDRRDLARRPVHASQLPPGVVEHLDSVVGRVVTVAVVEGGFVTRRNVGRGRGLEASLEPGMRAIRIVVGESVRPRRGNTVDVLASYERTDPAERVRTTVVVASAVDVLGTDVPRAGATADRALGVTLLVDEVTARDLADAATRAALTLALVGSRERAHG